MDWDSLRRQADFVARALFLVSAWCALSMCALLAIDSGVPGTAEGVLTALPRPIALLWTLGSIPALVGAAALCLVYTWILMVGGE